MEFPVGELVWWRGGTDGTGSAPHGAIRIILYTIYITPYINIYSPGTIANAQPREPSGFAPTYRARCYINIILYYCGDRKKFSPIVPEQIKCEIDAIFFSWNILYPTKIILWTFGYYFYCDYYHYSNYSFCILMYFMEFSHLIIS